MAQIEVHTVLLSSAGSGAAIRPSSMLLCRQWGVMGQFRGTIYYELGQILDLTVEVPLMPLLQVIGSSAVTGFFRVKTKPWSW